MKAVKKCAYRTPWEKVEKELSWETQRKQEKDGDFYSSFVNVKCSQDHKTQLIYTKYFYHMSQDIVLFEIIIFLVH